MILQIAIIERKIAKTIKYLSFTLPKNGLFKI